VQLAILATGTHHRKGIGLIFPNRDEDKAPFNKGPEAATRANSETPEGTLGRVLFSS
jgi:hypothetical protein